MTYSFITSTSWRTEDIKARNPKQAYKMALESHKALGGEKKGSIFGFITKSFYKYDKDGTTPIDRVFSLK